jgi:hypothetical protein
MNTDQNFLKDFDGGFFKVHIFRGILQRLFKAYLEGFHGKFVEGIFLEDIYYNF